MNPVTAEWQGFFTAELGALAALTGLVVVAISINLSRILAFAQLPGRAGESLTLLVGPLVVASVALIPGQPALALGLEVLTIGLATTGFPLVNQARTWRNARGVSDAQKVERVIVNLASSAPFVVGGLAIAFSFDGALYWLAGAIIVSLVAGVWNSWILLVEILR
jgi:modulator of FtsH protease